MNMKIVFVCLYLFATVLFISSCTNNKQKDTEMDERIEKRIDSLLRVMTIEEKIGQMVQVNIDSFTAKTIFARVRKGEIGSFLNAGDVNFRNQLQQAAMQESRLGIPLLFGRDVIHGYRTVFPIPLAQSCSWNPELVKKAAAIAALEASSEGIHWTFAPMVDIARDPRWGRIAETNGEDPYLGSQMAVAMVQGFQGDNLANNSSLAACAKHFVGYGAAEGGRDYNTTLIPESELRNTYLPPFHAAVNANVATIMSAFNDINGIPATANDFTLRKILRSEWGFKGFVVSDWTSVSELIQHGYATDASDAALKAVQAGVDMDMVSDCYARFLKELVTTGALDEEIINDAARNILRIKLRKGLFEHPYAPELRKMPFLQPESLGVAKELAKQSIVLLKNENEVLPLSPDIRKIAVVGPMADAPVDQLGMWTPDGKGEEAVTPLVAIRKMLGENKVIYAPGISKSRSTDKSQFRNAVRAARQADVCLIFAGEEQILSGEAHSRAFLNLPGAQEELITEIASTGKPVVLVIMAGRPLIFNKISGQVQAILYAWHGGTMAGPALADIIFGKDAPSGKLTVSFPRAEGQIPVYYNHRNTGRPPNAANLGIPAGTPLDPVNYSSNYLDLDYTPEYPFGYGMSYTTFAYSNLILSHDTLSAKDTLFVKTTIKNTGKYGGFEIIQLYIRDRVGSITRPVKELRAFRRVYLQPGETKEVSFAIVEKDLAFYGKDMIFRAEPGDFNLMIGKSSDDKDLLRASFYLTE
jgi:beta-glucosidase